MATATKPGVSGPSYEPIPPLRNGDHLTAAEFERRYDAMPHLKKAELIDGIVCLPPADTVPQHAECLAMSPPVSFRRHSSPHSKVMYWLGLHWDETPGVEVGDNGTLRLDATSMPQPDAFLLISPEHAGRARIGEVDHVEGGPELVVEVSARSASHDLGAKLAAFLRNGVREYVVWRTGDRAIDWFILRDGRYDRLGLATPEHAAFVERLRQRAAAPPAP